MCVYVCTHTRTHMHTLHAHTTCILEYITLHYTYDTITYWCLYCRQDAHRQLEKAHTILRRTAAIKLQSNIRRYLAIKKWPQMKHNLQHRTATPSPQTQGTPVSRIPNGEVGKILLQNCYIPLLGVISTTIP